MFTEISGLPDHVIGYEVDGKITAEDYRKILVPAIEERLETHNRLDFICVLGEKWDGVEPKAVWQDMKTGFSHLGRWGRIAIVTDTDWLENSVHMLKLLWPGHLQHFEMDELSKAKVWVSDIDRATVSCQIDEVDGLVILEPDPHHSLSEDDFLYISKKVDRYLENHESIKGILISAKKFPGWQGISGMLSHMRFVRDHHKEVGKIALVTDSMLGKVADYAADHFVKADVRVFDFDDRKEAVDWVRS